LPPRKTTAPRPRVKTRVRSARPKRRSRRRTTSAINIRRNERDKLAGKWFEKLVALQARLRAPNGCPWDREQTHESLRKFLIEETYEVLDAMETGDAREFSGELGDLLLQVIFHSILAEEAGKFTISDVIESVHTKMVRRHPHVFGDAKAANSAEVLKNWEQIKASERAEAHGRKNNVDLSGDSAASILAGVPRSLPAVLEAYQLTRRASRVGFDWDDLAGILDKLDEEKRELQSLLATDKRDLGATEQRAAGVRLEEEVGDLLFAGVNIARFLGIDPEIALKKANRKFKERFHFMEAAAASEGKQFANLSRERMEELWNSAKLAEQKKSLSTKSAIEAGNAR
jgi:tetrapyrrole methylase family protein / MazG family protein